MAQLAQIVLHFHKPNTDGHVPLTVTTLGGDQESGQLRIPFDLALAPLFLRALNARQYLDYPDPTVERFFQPDDDRASIIDTLQTHDLWEGDQQTGVIPIDVHARVGRILGATLSTDPAVKRTLRALHDLAVTTNGGEIVLRFDADAMAIAALPWEAAHNGQQPILLAGDTLLNCVRMIAFDHDLPPPLGSGARLRILTLAPHAGFYDPIQRQLETQARQRLHEELRDHPVEIHHLSPVLMADLQHVLERELPFDILDYYGHGRFKNGVGGLLFDNQNGGNDWVESNRLVTVPNLPRMILLHACQSAQTDPVDPMAGVASALSVAGVRTVVAMQFITRMVATTNWVIPTIYRHLARGLSIQRAVATARQALYTVEPDSASWYLPTVYLRQKEPSPVRLIESSPPANPFAGAGALGNVAQFSGHEQQRQRLWVRLCLGVNYAERAKFNEVTH